MDTKVNPADMASRGASVSGLIQSDQWIHGPQIPRKPETTWPKQPDGVKVLPAGDPEVKQLIRVGTATFAMVNILPINYLLQRCSDLKRLSG